MNPLAYDPAGHYDRVTAAWTLLLGEELHYGVFAHGDEELAVATRGLTTLMVAALQPQPDARMLDVGCGTGAPACHLASAEGMRVTGITTSTAGVTEARARAAGDGLDKLATFEERDGMDNGFPDQAFDRVWALESSHLMRDRGRLMGECARVLVPGGRLALCDIVLKRPLDLREVKRLREPLGLLRQVFGDARMEPLGEYARLATEAGLTVDQQVDLTSVTQPTFARWRDNAESHREEVVASIGAEGWQQFVDSCDVLEGFWDDGTLGYGLLSASK